MRLRYPLHYDESSASRLGQDQLDPALLAAVIEAESKFDPDAVRRPERRPHAAHADHRQGHRAVHGRVDSASSDLTNPDINVRYGAFYLGHLLERYDDERLALAAYNAGQENVDRWQRKDEGIQFEETRDYISKVERLQKIYRRAYASELGYRFRHEDRAALLEAFGSPLEVQEIDLAEPKAGEVLVRLVACGVCHTDLFTASGADPPATRRWFSATRARAWWRRSARASPPSRLAITS